MSHLPSFRNMLSYIDSKMDGFSMPNTDRNIAAGTLYDVSIDHAKGICLLLEQHLYPSAYALVRCMFESFVRGAWLLHCASDTELTTFIQKDKIELDSKEKFTFDDMLLAVESNSGWPTTLSEIKRRVWGALNSYTHGGQFQIVRRYDGSTIEPHHDPEQINEIVQFSAIIAFLAFSGIMELSETDGSYKFVMELKSQIDPWCFNKSIQPTANASAD